MIDSSWCPACDSQTSSISEAFKDGSPCPYCGLPAEAAAQVIVAQSRGTDEELTRRYTEAMQRAVKAEAEASWRTGQILRIRSILDEKQPERGDLW